MFWDKGAYGISRFLNQHAEMCQDNIYCNALGLKQLRYSATSQSPMSTPNKVPRIN